MKNFFKDFINFIKKGNVIDLAIGIIIGGAFNTIVRSLVNDIIMPLIGLVVKSNISEAKIVLVGATATKSAVTLNYGAFLQSIVDFLIIALAIFITVQIMKKIHTSIEKSKNKLLKRSSIHEEEIKKPTTEEILIDIRDLLSKSQK
jgi:large conductance mechanosensitive channel